MGGILRLPSFIATYPLPPEDSTTINRLSHRSTSPSNCLETSMAKDVFLQHASNWQRQRRLPEFSETALPIPIFWWYSNCKCWFFKMILEIDMFFCHVGEIISGASVSCRLLCKSGIDWFFARGGVRCRTPRTSCARMAWELLLSLNKNPIINLSQPSIIGISGAHPP